MPKLPVASGKDVITALQRLGFAVMRQNGSHVVLRRGSVGCVVPLHRQVRRGTLSTIIQQAGVAPEELIEALR